VNAGCVYLFYTKQAEITTNVETILPAILVGGSAE
jgi:hypothetical protein